MVKGERMNKNLSYTHIKLLQFSGFLSTFLLILWSIFILKETENMVKTILICVCTGFASGLQIGIQLLPHFLYKANSEDKENEVE
jgi:hypothetical protein